MMTSIPHHGRADSQLWVTRLATTMLTRRVADVDWLLTVPLLLIEIVLVMGLDEDETFNRCCTLGVSSALMIAFGYPGETSGDVGKRWVFWCISMTPFCYIVYTLFIGLAEAQASQDARAPRRGSLRLRKLDRLGTELRGRVALGNRLLHARGDEGDSARHQGQEGQHTSELHGVFGMHRLAEWENLP